MSAFTSTVPEVVLASTATALLALTKFPDAPALQHSILQLTDFLKDWTQTIRQLPYGCGAIDCATPPKTIRSICQSLLQARSALGRRVLVAVNPI